MKQKRLGRRKWPRIRIVVWCLGPSKARPLLLIASALIVAAITVGSCSGSDGSPEPASSRPVTDGSTQSSVAPASPPPGAKAVAGGCASTQLYVGALPTWLDPIVQQLSNMNDVPFGVSGDSTAAAFVLSYPLKANVNHPKVLWIVEAPQGASIDLEVHPLGSTTPLIKESIRGDSLPAGTYPDGVTIPSPGCWQFEIRWSSHVTAIDLLYG